MDKLVSAAIVAGLKLPPTYANAGSDKEVSAAIFSGLKLPFVKPTRLVNSNVVKPPSGAPASLYTKLFSIHSPAGVVSGFEPLMLTPEIPTLSESASCTGPSQVPV